MFRITSGKGFQITFDNGWTLSVQFGPGNYCENYGMSMAFDKWKDAGERGSKDAEIAIIKPDGDLFGHPDFSGDTVNGNMKANDVLEYMIWTAGQ